MFKLPQNLTTLLFGVLIVNVIGLWTVYLISRPAKTTTLPSITTQDESGANSSLPADPELVATEADTIADLREQLDEISGVVATLSAEPKTITKTVTNSVSSQSAKEYVIYLGSGSTTSREWVEIEGTKTTVNTANYPTIKNMEFQASLKIVGGEARARLKNKTTGAIFHDSEVMHNSSVVTWVSRTGLPLHGGNNEYVVELRSTSGELAQLEGARLRLTVE
jgi:hypothetical protein